MDFKTFLIKKIMMSFFVSVTFICSIMAVLGMIYETNVIFGYEAFWSPLIFGAIASLPILVKYSKNELSFKEALIRNIIHFILLEATILSTLYYLGLISSLSKLLSLGVSIGLINLTVQLVLWINDSRSSREFNVALKRMQAEYISNEE